ncbi:hypothetical protein T265_01017 [Opisthorchis viverrini]|uniref:Uncharacterized protein n=1 Tax=Opisthorchis viverrini TaxID=6198 RepID=A0A075A1A3_OPIVI|nr:hypothetical protein T265_01017 [Opisthorchis viverrini]KER33131.1 hypothetical protein T265_01017 [Opisthorchis viverrini]
MAQSRSQWRSSFSNPSPLDSPLTVLDLCTNLSAPACNTQLPNPPPQTIGERNCGSYNHCTTSTRLLQLTVMMMKWLFVFPPVSVPFGMDCRAVDSRITVQLRSSKAATFTAVKSTATCCADELATMTAAYGLIPLAFCRHSHMVHAWENSQVQENLMACVTDAQEFQLSAPYYEAQFYPKGDMVKRPHFLFLWYPPYQSMKFITRKLSCADYCRLLGYGPRDWTHQWLETQSNVAQSHSRWCWCIQAIFFNAWLFFQSS